jgi:nucleoside-diphosphate-sugar epimerase
VAIFEDNDVVNGRTARLRRNYISIIRDIFMRKITELPKKRILVTGAFGLLGRRVVESLLAHGFSVTAFDKPGISNRCYARKLKYPIRIVWGDIRSETDIMNALKGCDTIVHLAYVLPPASEDRPAYAETINVGGSEKLIRCALSLSPAPSLLFASSYTVYGNLIDGPPVGPEVGTAPLNHYTRQKVTIENRIRESGLTWSIFRFGTVLDQNKMFRKADNALIFDLPADGRQEFVDSRDAALAITRLVRDESSWNKTYLIGGGSACQLRYIDMINDLIGSLGIPPLPPSAFSPIAKQGGCWMDTSESQNRFQYQRTDFRAFRESVVRSAGILRKVTRIFGPVIRAWLLRNSPYMTGSGKTGNQTSKRL